MNCGPARLAQHMVTLDYCRELSVPVEVFTNANEDAYYYQESAGALSGRKIRHRTAKADYNGYVSELLAKATDQGALDAALSVEDKERLLAFLEDFGAIGGRVPADAAASWRYTGSDRRGYVVEPGAGTEQGEVLGPPFALTDLLQSQIGFYFSFESFWTQAMLMYQPVGGMDRIAFALAKAVEHQGGRIHYNVPVQEISNTAAGVEVRVEGHRNPVGGDYCVCTIPPQILKDVPTNLSDPVKTALAYPVGASVGKIGLEYRRRFWEEDEHIMGGITNTNMDLSTIWYPSYGYLGSRGTLIGYYNFGANAETYSKLTPGERRARAVAQGKKIHGDPYATELDHSFSVAWHRTRYSQGGWVSCPHKTAESMRSCCSPTGTPTSPATTSATTSPGRRERSTPPARSSPRSTTASSRPGETHPSAATVVAAEGEEEPAGCRSVGSQRRRASVRTRKFLREICAITRFLALDAAVLAPACKPAAA